jgi:inosine-uridine nucleoside N-ribohydrolase
MTRSIAPRARVICDNDFCGDPDGLVQLAHHLLSPSVELRGVIGSQLPDYDTTCEPDCQVERSLEKAQRLVQLTDREDVPLHAGSNVGLASSTEPAVCSGAEVIVVEAMRDDTELPLFVACGGSLTAVASAWLMEPRIGERVTVVWIGGPEHEGVADTPAPFAGVEYNTSTDLAAAEVVFGRSDLELWQVPRDAYRQVLASHTELHERMRPHGELGRHLFDEVVDFHDGFAQLGFPMGETYILGDSPLVLLTALTGSFDPSPSSSVSVRCPRQHLDDAGNYGEPADGPPIRVFTRLDTRLLLEDLYSKLARRAATH